MIFLEQYGIEMKDLFVFFGILVSSFLIGLAAKLILHKTSLRLKRLQREISSVLLESFSKSAIFIGITIGFYAGTKVFDLQANLDQILDTSSSILLIIAIAFLLFKLVEVPAIWFELKMNQAEKNINKMFIPVIRKILRAVVIILAIIQIIQVLSDKPIASIIAGLGIGGLAVALAAQDSIKHLFGSVVLIGDKPFNIGDRILIDSHDGIVEQVGLRSSRIRTLEGHLLTVPNGDLANKIIENIGERKSIRRLANITITYETPPNKIQEAIEILKDILKDHEGMNPDFPPRVYFNDLTADSLNILVLYWYFPADFWAYMDFTQKVNFEIISRFNNAGIEFAYPTQKLFMAGDENQPVNLVGLTNQ